MTTDAQAIDLPFREAISFFREKVNVPTRRWNDIWRGEHSHQFMVAGATADALLGDFKDAIRKALEKGTTLEEFRKDFDTIVAKHGWEYNGTRDWRSRIIYETNLATSYSAGRYAQLTEPETLKAFPYWQYIHSGSSHPRLQHLAWNGLTLRADDPFWDTHYPPNGWRCGCRVAPRDGVDLKRVGKNGPDQAPPIQYRDWKDKVTGTVHKVPVGIDPGWDYNPGQAKKGGIATPVKSDPMKELPGPGTPTAPQKSAPLPPMPPGLQAWLDNQEGNFSLGDLPVQVQKALGTDVAQVSFSPISLSNSGAKQRIRKSILDDRHYAVLPTLVRNPTVVLRGDKEHVLLLRQSGRVYVGLLPAEANASENILQAFYQASFAETKNLLDSHDQVYGDADDLGDDDE